jgi:GNAT superfamily N-acetyltransferase
MGVSVRKVDGSKDRIADTLRALHNTTFGRTAPMIDPAYGHWWIAFDGTSPVAFAGIVQSTYAPHVGYLKRSGVIPSYRGQGLQRRLLAAREGLAKRVGWKRVISDTAYHNIHSSNNMIRSGYRLFAPPYKWAFKDSLYWTKDIA